MNWRALVTPLLFTTAFIGLTVAERRRPLRRRVEPGRQRVGRNLAMAGLTAAITGLLQKPLVGRALRRTAAGRGGLLGLMRLPRATRLVLGVLLLDYTLWWWHWANHVVPPLWRFHLVHHVDRDLDTSTALRFHFGEMALAAGFRSVQVALLGVEPAALIWWQRMLLVSIVFHHSNLRLPAEAERRLVSILVTPRMHGIHHSEVEAETQSNWSSLFSWWDRMHGTFLWDVPQEAIAIGVPAWREPLSLGRLLEMPFGPQREDWVSAVSAPPR